MSETIHVPVMPREVIDGLNIREGDTVVDATLGEADTPSSLWSVFFRAARSLPATKTEKRLSDFVFV